MSPLQASSFMVDFLPKHQLIVSVQAEAHEPLSALPVLEALCASVLGAGASALRLAHPQLIRSMRAQYPKLPVIGLTKPEPLPLSLHKQVYITPTLADGLMLAEAGASIIATDATARPRPEGETLASWVKGMREQAPDVALMADISTFDEGLKALALGFDVIGTTLSGYTLESLARQAEPKPDYELLARLVEAAHNEVPIVLEGRVATAEQAALGLELGAYAVVVGSAITRPHWITQQFLKGMAPFQAHASQLPD